MKKIPIQMARAALLILAAALACAALARYAPGGLVDEREMDRRLSEDSLAALRARTAEKRGVAATLLRYARGLAKGDLGYSESHSEEIATLVAERAGVTGRELAVGLAGGWILGLGLAIPVARYRRAWMLEAGTAAGFGLLLSVPTALVAYLCLAAGAATEAALALIVAPRVFQFTRNLLGEAYGAAHVAMARARGVGEGRILAAHIFPAVAGQLAALGAASLSMAIGGAIAVEAICGVPGLGQLAWQAAMARDVPLLIDMTVLITAATMAATAFSGRVEAAVAV